MRLLTPDGIVSLLPSPCAYTFSAPVCRRHVHALTSCTGWLRYTGTTDRDCPWIYSHDRLPLDILLLASSYGIACRVSHPPLISSLILLCNKQLLYSTSYGIKREVQGCERYAVCHIMKKQYGWTNHKKWQRCVSRTIDNSEFCQRSRRKRKSYLCYRTS